MWPTSRVTVGNVVNRWGLFFFLQKLGLSTSQNVRGLIISQNNTEKKHLTEARIMVEMTVTGVSSGTA